jgi:hypothetical protein
VLVKLEWGKNSFGEEAFNMETEKSFMKRRLSVRRNYRQTRVDFYNAHVLPSFKFGLQTSLKSSSSPFVPIQQLLPVTNA